MFHGAPVRGDLKVSVASTAAVAGGRCRMSSTLYQAVADYLTVRRSLGYKLARPPPRGSPRFRHLPADCRPGHADPADGGGGGLERTDPIVITLANNTRRTAETSPPS